MERIEINDDFENLDEVFTSTTDLEDYGIGIGCSGLGSASCQEGCKSGNKNGGACSLSCMQGCSEGCKDSCKPGKK